MGFSVWSENANKKARPVFGESQSLRIIQDAGFAIFEGKYLTIRGDIAILKQPFRDNCVLGSVAAHTVIEDV